MPSHSTIARRSTLLAALLIAAGSAMPLAAQDRPARDALGRRPTTGQTTTLAFRDVTVERVIPFIVESTGKIVLPQRDVLNQRITIINDEPIPQSVALDYVFLALQQAGIAVVEREDIILLRNIEEIDRQDVLVIGPHDSVLGRQDVGNIAEKVFMLRYNTAKNMETVLKDALPSYAKLAIDEKSNSIVVRGNISLLQRMEQLVNSLDRPSETLLTTQTFRLRYADADQVAQNIKDLYEDQNNQSRAGGNRQQQMQQFMQRGGRPPQDDGASSSPSANLRVTANTQQNSVTVVAETAVVAQIASLIESNWDQPLQEEAVVPRIYDLKHSDPIKVRDLLLGLFGQPGSNQGGSSSSGVGRLAGQFTFQALPEAGRLVVIAKSPDNLFVIDEIIRGLDQPQDVGLPEIIELKHANAEELAEQLNALLATEGTIAEIRRAESGLSTSTNSSPFAQDQNTSNESTSNSPDLLQFWWQSARVPTENRGASNLVGRIRIVPVWRQNAVMVLSPPEYRQSVTDLISQLDKPGRQVLISAVIAEISVSDANALGLRWSSSTISTTNPDNAFSVGFNASGTENRFLGSLFDTSVLNADVDLNAVLQALSQRTAVNILSEPRIFTADNQEAEFFDGQDIPFITDSQTTDQGGLIQSTDYRAVGIQLRVRPRITINRDVDLRVNLELSSIAPGVTVNNQFIVDRRETSTQLIIQDGQTVVISGILRSEESNVRRKVPLLGDIPLVGLLFQSVEKEVSSSELVAFITPLVIHNEESMNQVNAPYRQRLNTLRDSLDDDLEKLRRDTGGTQAVPTPQAP